MMEIKLRMVSSEAFVYDHDSSKVVQSEHECNIGDELEVVNLAPLVLTKELKEKLFKKHEIKVRI